MVLFEARLTMAVALNTFCFVEVSLLRLLLESYKLLDAVVLRDEHCRLGLLDHLEGISRRRRRALHRHAYPLERVERQRMAVQDDRRLAAIFPSSKGPPFA